MRWRKLGLIFDPERDAPWLGTHAAVPFACPVEEGQRVFFSTRDASGRARIAAFEFDMEAPFRIRRISPRPVLEPGPLGAFHDAGVTTSWEVALGQRRYQYYTGWALGVSVPFYLCAGLAISEDGGQTYSHYSDAPLLERQPGDPYLSASPCVLVDGDVWRMWYVAGSRWEQAEGGPRHYYHIRYAESADGLRWRRDGRACIDYASADEHAIARPCVLCDPDRYRMWYCFRGEQYRIGYAESADGLQWERRDSEAGIEPSDVGWDAEMIAYPFVFDHGGRRYMLYNGNGYGRTGIGLAALVE